MPPTTSICHSSIGRPRSHRFQSWLRRRRANGSIRFARRSARYTPDSDTVVPALASSNTIRRGPHPGCTRRSSRTVTSAWGSIWCGPVPGRCERSANASSPPLLVAG